MNLKKTSLFILIGSIALSPCINSSSVFQTMAMTITQQLFPIAQTATQSSDQQLQQLIRSVCSQLQNTTQTKDIKNVIDVVLNVLEQKQNHTQEIGVLLVVIVSSHALRIIAQKLYRSISFVRKSLLYWKKIDQLSPLQYYVSHIPTVWNLKFNSDFQIKEKIAQTEKIYAGYVAQLGAIVRLIHQLPQGLHMNTNIAWVNNALSIFKKHTVDEAIVTPDTKPFNAVILLKYTKLFLEHFDPEFNAEFQHIKNAIGLPSYFAQNFGKIMAYTIGVGSVLFSSYYYSDKIGTWIQNAKDNVKSFVWNPIYDNVKAIFSTQEKDLLMDQANLKEIIKESKELQVECWDDLKKIAPTNEENEHLRKDILKLLPKISEIDAQNIVLENNYALYEQFLADKDGQYFWDISGKTKDIVGAYSVKFSLLRRQLMPKAYKSQANLAGIVAELAKALQRLDTDLVSLRKLAILTPALFAVAGTYKAGSAIYNYMTHKDYTNLKVALKELETVSICAMNQPKSDSSYGLFIFLLETLKIGVVQTVSSRYTKRNELLEDLKRLESLDLTFKQRLKLIEQIQKSYSIFNQS